MEANILSKDRERGKNRDFAKRFAQFAAQIYIIGVKQKGHFI